MPLFARSFRRTRLRVVGPDGQPTAAGLDRMELALFIGGILMIGLFMALFLQPLSDPIGAVVLVSWLVGGLAYVRWLHLDLAKRPPGGRRGTPATGPRRPR
jgi:hypothetical protein